MNTILSRSLAALVLAILAASGSVHSTVAQTSSAKPAPKAATAAPANLPLIDAAGYSQILAKYRGKPLMVSFWATWCEPCRMEYPMIVELAKQYAAKGLNVFGVSLDDDSEINLVRHFLTQNRPGFPNYRQKPGIDVDAFYHAVNPQWEGTMPETIFYGRDGRILVHFTGGQPREIFEKAIGAIVATQTSQDLQQSILAVGQ